MQEGAPPDGRSPQVLLDETRRVLDAQQRIVQRQRTQATNAVRILLTACGLVFTLASFGISFELSVLPPTTDYSPVQMRRALPSLVAVTLGILVVLGCRMLCAALVVLEPRTTAQPLVRILTTPIRAKGRPRSAMDADVTLRTGLDADATTDLSDDPAPVRAVVAYNAGCVAGNAALVEQNRWYLTRLYRSGVVAVVLVSVLVVFGVLLSVLGGPV